jgi:hypothetical protein
MSGLGSGYGKATVNSIPQRSIIDRMMAGYRRDPADNLRRRIASLIYRRMQGLGARLKEGAFLSGPIEAMYEAFQDFERGLAQSGESRSACQ